MKRITIIRVVNTHIMPNTICRLYLCAAEAEMFPGTPTVHSTYKKGPDLVTVKMMVYLNTVSVTVTSWYGTLHYVTLNNIGHKLVVVTSSR
jgi:hypothetical protein